MEQRRKRVGIMGGTFNPVHIGHLLIAEQSYHEYGLDYVVFMPAGRPPHKQHENILANRERLNMLLLATRDIPYFRVSDYELNKRGLSYTYETLAHFTYKNKDTDYYFIMGADSVNDMETWRHPEIIFQLVHVLAAVRGDTDIARLKRQAKYLKEQYQARISLLGAPEMDISSRELRERIAAGASIRFMVPEMVRSYIDFHHLYTKGECAQ